MTVMSEVVPLSPDLACAISCSRTSHLHKGQLRADVVPVHEGRGDGHDLLGSPGRARATGRAVEPQRADLAADTAGSVQSGRPAGNSDPHFRWLGGFG